MKKNKTMRLAAVLLVCVLLTTSVISGTFAKYTSEATGTDSARVAKWAFEVNDAKIHDVNEFAFNLFNTVYEVGTTADDEDVAGNATIIAPGTEGQFAIVLENLSEVTATYAIDYEVDNDGVPLEYSVDGGANWSVTLADVPETVIAMEGGNATITVQWRWAFTGAESQNYTTNQTDAYDTQLGIAYDAEPTVTATVTATQYN